MKKKFVFICELACFALLLGVAVYNYFSCGCSFFKASVAQLITPFIALIFAFWATQYKNDQRKAKEHTERIIIKIQEIVSNEKFFTISTSENNDNIRKLINTTNRKISNNLGVLSNYSKVFEFVEEYKYIENQFKSYKEITGEHINDIDYLSKTESEFRRIADNVDSKCETIVYKLYK